MEETVNHTKQLQSTSEIPPQPSSVFMAMEIVSPQGSAQGPKNPQESPNTPPSRHRDDPMPREGTGSLINPLQCDPHHDEREFNAVQHDSKQNTIAIEKSPSQPNRSATHSPDLNQSKPYDVSQIRVVSPKNPGSSCDKASKGKSVGSSWPSPARIDLSQTHQTPAKKGNGTDQESVNQSTPGGGQSTMARVRPSAQKRIHKRQVKLDMKPKLCTDQLLSAGKDNNTAIEQEQMDGMTPGFSSKRPNNQQFLYDGQNEGIGDKDVEKQLVVQESVDFDGQKVAEMRDQNQTQANHTSDLIKIDNMDKEEEHNEEMEADQAPLTMHRQQSFMPNEDENENDQFEKDKLQCDEDLKQSKNLLTVQPSTNQMSHIERMRKSLAAQNQTMYSPALFQQPKMETPDIVNGRIRQRTPSRQFDSPGGFQEYRRDGGKRKVSDIDIMRRGNVTSKPLSNVKEICMAPKFKPDQYNDTNQRVISMAPKFTPEFAKGKQDISALRNSNQNPFPSHNPLNNGVSPMLFRRGQNQMESPCKPTHSPMKNIFESPLVVTGIDRFADHDNDIQNIMAPHMNGFEYHKTDPKTRQYAALNNMYTLSDFQNQRNNQHLTPRKRIRLDSDNFSQSNDGMMFPRGPNFDRYEMHNDYAIAKAYNQSPNLNRFMKGTSDQNVEQIQQSSLNVGHAPTNFIPCKNTMSNMAVHQSSMGGHLQMGYGSESHKNSFQTPVKRSNNGKQSNSVHKQAACIKRRVNDSNNQANIQTSSEQLPTTVTKCDGSDLVNSAEQVHQTPTMAYNHRDSLLDSDPSKVKGLDKFQTAGKPRVGDVFDGPRFSKNNATPFESIQPEVSDQDQRFNPKAQMMQTPTKLFNRAAKYRTPKRQKRVTRNAENQQMVTPDNHRLNTSSRNGRRGCTNCKSAVEHETPSQCSKNQTGLKTIAKEVTEILKDREFMTYNEAAQIIVNRHLKDQNDSDNGDNPSNDNNSQNGEISAIDQNSQLNATASKFRRRSEQRSKKEDNLRRRIYDAWNVLKAASIIVEHDDKNYWINQVTLQSLVDFSSDDSSDDDLNCSASNFKSPIKSKRKKTQNSNDKKNSLLLRNDSKDGANQLDMNQKAQGEIGQNETSREAGCQPQDIQGHEEHLATKGLLPSGLEQDISAGDLGLGHQNLLSNAEMTQQIQMLKKQCAERNAIVKEKLKKSSTEVRNIVEVRRLIKRNRKIKEQSEKAVKRRRNATQKGDKNTKQGENPDGKVMQIPFITVRYNPMHLRPEKEPIPGVVYEANYCCVTSSQQFEIQGDMTILQVMRKVNLIPDCDITEILGPQGAAIENTFKRAESIIKNFRESYESKQNEAHQKQIKE